jgi:hypothetical protein
MNRDLGAMDGATELICLSSMDLGAEVVRFRADVALWSAP